MSAKLMGMVFDLDLRPDEQTIMLCLADHADDDGRNVYPSVAYLAWKSGRSERTVQRILRNLETIELIERISAGTGGRGRATEYAIHIEKGVRKTPFSQTVKGDSVTPFRSKRVTDGALKGDRALSPQPSVEPSVKELLPTVVTPLRAERPRNVLWDALEAEWGPAPTGSANHGMFVKAVSMYRAAAFTPEMIYEAHRLYREDDHFGNLAYTILAVAKNAQQLLRAKERPPKIKSTAMRALATMNEEEYIRVANERSASRYRGTHLMPTTPRELGDGGAGTRDDVCEATFRPAAK